MSFWRKIFMPATNLKERIFTCDLHLFPEIELSNLQSQSSCKQIKNNPQKLGEDRSIKYFGYPHLIENVNNVIPLGEYFAVCWVLQFFTRFTLQCRTHRQLFILVNSLISETYRPARSDLQLLHPFLLSTLN